MQKLVLLLGSLLIMESAMSTTRLVSVDKSLWTSLKSVFSKKAKVRYETAEAQVLEVNESDINELSSELHHKKNRCGGFIQHANLEEFKAITEKKPQSFSFKKLELTQENLIHRMLPDVSESRLRQEILSLSQFRTRYYKSPEGLAAVLFQFEAWKKLFSHRSDVTVELFQHKVSPQPSIIVTIQGSILKDETVILGGHIDSISHLGAESPAPGVDDNASGIGSISEVLRLLVQYDLRPKRTVKFMAFAAEEVGMLGSMEIAKHLRKQKEKVIGMLQLDMTLFKGTKDKHIVLMKDYSHKKLNTFLGRLIDAYVKVPWGYDYCGYACSDHASFDAQGFPASFAHESMYRKHNPHIHTAKDTLDKVGDSAEHALVFTQLALAFVVELGF